MRILSFKGEKYDTKDTQMIFVTWRNLARDESFQWSFFKQGNLNKKKLDWSAKFEHLHNWALLSYCLTSIATEQVVNVVLNKSKITIEHKNTSTNYLKKTMSVNKSKQFCTRAFYFISYFFPLVKRSGLVINTVDKKRWSSNARRLEKQQLAMLEL